MILTGIRGENIMDITEYFHKLTTKDIICWGSGKHFRNSTYPFLKKSGLLGNLKGVIDPSGTRALVLDEKHIPRLDRSDLSVLEPEHTMLLIAVTGYEEILAQLQGDPRLAKFEAVPAMYLENLYEDLQLLSVEKAPLRYRKHKEPQIPRIIHALWFSENPMPKLYQRCLESWKRFAPDFEIRIWTLDTYQPKHCLFFEQAVAHKNWAFASDYARADVLRRYGGIYMDLDVEMVRPIDDLLYNDAYMSFESLDRIECGSGMGARPHHPIIQAICESYENRPYFKPDGSWDNSTCPVRYTKVIERFGLQKNGSFQFVQDVTVYPFEALTAKSFDTGVIYNTEHTYTIHHHNGSWIPDPAHKAVIQRYERIQEFLKNLTMM